MGMFEECLPKSSNMGIDYNKSLAHPGHQTNKGEQ